MKCSFCLFVRELNPLIQFTTNFISSINQKKKKREWRKKGEREREKNKTKRNCANLICVHGSRFDKLSSKLNYFHVIWLQKLLVFFWAWLVPPIQSSNAKIIVIKVNVEFFFTLVVSFSVIPSQL